MTKKIQFVICFQSAVSRVIENLVSGKSLFFSEIASFGVLFQWVDISENNDWEESYADFSTKQCSRT